MDPRTTGTAVTIANLSGGMAMSSEMNGKREEINTHTMKPTTRLAVCKGNWIFLFIYISVHSESSEPLFHQVYQMMDVYNSSNN